MLICALRLASWCRPAIRSWLSLVRTIWQPMNRHACPRSVCQVLAAKVGGEGLRGRQLVHATASAMTTTADIPDAHAPDAELQCIGAPLDSATCHLIGQAVGLVALKGLKVFFASLRLACSPSALPVFKSVL
jgi:hypothetical protein